MKIYVWSPNYTHKSAGIEVLHYLMYLLQRNGHEVFTGTNVFNPEFDLKPQYDPNADWGEVSQYDFLIYPEVKYSIEFEKPILRWVLYFPGVLAGPVNYRSNEIVYHWAKEYEMSAINASYQKQSKEFSLPYIKKHEYEFKPVERKGDLLFVYKGKNLHEHPEPVLEITGDVSQTREALLDLLRTHETLWSYDNHSRLNMEAYLMGMSVNVYNYSMGSWKKYVIDKKSVRFIDYAEDEKLIHVLINDFIKRSEVKKNDNSM